MKIGSALAAFAAVLSLGCVSGDDAPAPQAASGPALFVARDADSTLYLFGTIHLRRAGEPWGSAAVESALASSEEIWTEMPISAETDARAQELTLQLGRAPRDRPLSSWLSADEARRLSETAQRLGLQAQALEPLQPWLAGLTLTLIPMLQAGYDPDAGVDRAVDAFGDANGKRMRAFETPEQQIGFLAGLPAEVQRAMLLEAIDEAGKGSQILDEMSDAWERGDTDALERLLNAEMREEYPEVYAALIARRNDAWMTTLMEELRGAGVDFVAVGAAHIVGDDGLVAQLRARGVRVERVGSR